MRHIPLIWCVYAWLTIRHIYFVGPGLVSAVAYIDPGNWATDLEAGAGYGYKLLFIVLLAGLAAVCTCCSAPLPPPPRHALEQ